ncbi:MAG: DMT family transporter [Bacteroidales bacterium]|nr:DMT family transporter [Bacteroidales bacterium]
MKSRNWFYYLLLMVSSALWGSSFIFTKRLLEVADPVVIICSRVMIAGPFFLLICLLFFRKNMRIDRKDIPTVIAFSCFEPFLYFIFETYSLTRCDASVVSIIVATIPIATAFLSLFYFKENFTKLNMLGVFVSFFGIFLMLFPAFMNASVSISGVILAFGAVGASVGYMFFLKKLPEHYNPVVIITYQNLIGLVLFTPLMLILTAPSLAGEQLTALFALPLLYYLASLAILCSALAFMFYLQGMRHFGVGKANTFTNLIPIVTAVLSFFLLHENFPLYKILGIIIVIVGIFLVQKKKAAII